MIQSIGGSDHESGIFANRRFGIGIFEQQNNLWFKSWVRFLLRDVHFPNCRGQHLWKIVENCSWRQCKRRSYKMRRRYAYARLCRILAYVVNLYTSSTAQGGGGSFKDRTTIGWVVGVSMTEWQVVGVSMFDWHILLIFLMQSGIHPSSFCLSVRLSDCLSACPSMLSIYLSVYFSVYQSVKLSVGPSIYLLVLSILLSFFLSF